MSGFPVQLRWSQFVGVFHKLGYKPVRVASGFRESVFQPDPNAKSNSVP